MGTFTFLILCWLVADSFVGLVNFIALRDKVAALEKAVEELKSGRSQ